MEFALYVTGTRSGGLGGGAGTFSATFLSLAGGLDRFTVGGSLIGGAGDRSGALEFETAGAIGPVKIGGDLAGGAGHASGEIVDHLSIGSVTIGGSIFG